MPEHFLKLSLKSILPVPNRNKGEIVKRKRGLVYLNGSHERSSFYIFSLVPDRLSCLVRSKPKLNNVFQM